MADAKNPPYQYKRLQGPRDIRLLTLLPGTSDQLLSLTVKHASLDHNPGYEALSYVWGPQMPSYTIQCDGNSLEIGQNLNDALTSFRNVNTPRLLWIDRIAINQHDLDERSQQVGLMGDIYASASMVLVWLGVADAHTEPAFRLISHLSAQIFERWRAQRSGAMAESLIMTHPIDYPPSHDPRWTYIRSVLERPWSSRVWTFQEIVLAKKATAYCGKFLMGWNAVENLLNGLQRWPPGPNIEDSMLRGVEFFQEFTNARSFEESDEFYNPDADPLFLTLLPLLDGLRYHQATDPRDKVFALLNVARDAKDSDLKADYSKPPADIYAITTRWLVRTQRKLAILSLVEKKDQPDLISWVPDFRYKDKWNFLHESALPYRGIRKFFNASGNTNADLVEDEPLNQLTLRGILVGTIVDTTDPPGNLLGKTAIGARVLDSGQWHLFAKGCAVNGVYPATNEPIDIAWHRLRIWDILPGEGPGRRRRESPPTKIPQPGPISYDAATGGIIHGPSKDIGISILRATTRKKLFKTDTGYMGLAHRSIETGDKVFVLMGGELPFVLRPFGSKFYGFGGESNVHGIMDGEMLGIARARQDGLASSFSKDLEWINKLGDRPWPFETEEVILV